jgi:ubiquinone biosynthesis protein
MGTLSEGDKAYLAGHMRAFFERDYHRLAAQQVEAGWVPADTRVDQLEAELRALCEPIFDRPLKEIYFGKLLVRLFEAGRRFGIEVQPQLSLLVKTMLQVEGLGRQLDPDLDLRRTAQPILERFMRRQFGWRGLVKEVIEEAPLWARTAGDIPRLVHHVLSEESPRRIEAAIAKLEAAQRRQTRVLALIAFALTLLVVGYLLR